MSRKSLTKALVAAGVLAVAGLANADAIFYPDGSHVDLGENAVENGVAGQVLAMSPGTAPSNTQLASLGLSPDANVAIVEDTTVLGAGPAMRILGPLPAPGPNAQACSFSMNSPRASCTYLPG